MSRERASVPPLRSSEFDSDHPEESERLVRRSIGEDVVSAPGLAGGPIFA